MSTPGSEVTTPIKPKAVRSRSATIVSVQHPPVVQEPSQASDSKIQIVTNTWIGEGGGSAKYPVLLNRKAFPAVQVGDLIEVTPGPALLAKGKLKGSPARGGFLFKYEDHPLEKGQVNSMHLFLEKPIGNAFGFSSRNDLKLQIVEKREEVYADYVELYFKDQYVGRADMWRLGVSLEEKCVYVGQEVSSAYFTTRTKTIYRSSSAKFHIFVQVCREMFEFAEDGERYHEKAIHGFLPELLAKWAEKKTNHSVSIILFARIRYQDDEVEFLKKTALQQGEAGLEKEKATHDKKIRPMKRDREGRAYEDFYQVVIDTENITGTSTVIRKLKKEFAAFERSVLLEQHYVPGTEAKILGEFVYAHEGNILECVNLALNPYDKHYLDRDFVRTGLSIIIITPGTCRFTVDKRLLRMTAERLDSHGIAIDLVSLTKMPLHSVPLFSFYSLTPEVLAKAKHKKLDPLYVDLPPEKSDQAKKLTDQTMPKMDEANAILNADYSQQETYLYYIVAFWVTVSNWSKSRDRIPWNNQFIPRVKMSKIQNMGLLDHDITPICIPLLPFVPLPPNATPAEILAIKEAHMDHYDDDIFNKKQTHIGGDLRSNFSFRSGQDVSSSAASSHWSDAEGRGSLTKPSPLSQSFPGTLQAAMESSLPRVAEEVLILKQGFSPSNSLHLPSHTILQHGGSTQLSSRPPSMRSFVSSTASIPPPASPSGSSTPVANIESPGKTAFPKSSSSLWSKLGLGGYRPSLLSATQPTDSSIPSLPKSQLSPQPPSLPTSTSPTPTPTPRLTPPESTLTPPSVQSSAKAAPVQITSVRESLRREESKMEKPSAKGAEELSQSNNTGLSTSENEHNHTVRKVAPLKQRLVNPCNPSKDDIDLSEIGRWQHIFPRGSNEHQVKWKSLTTPACLPITSDFMPPKSELTSSAFTTSVEMHYVDAQHLFLVKRVRQNEALVASVMREMTSQRLAQGFQVVVQANETEVSHGHHGSRRKKISAAPLPGGASEALRAGSGSVFLALTNQVHEIRVGSAAVGSPEVQVNRYIRNVISYRQLPIPYDCMVLPALAPKFSSIQSQFSYPTDREFNWQLVDRQILGDIPEGNENWWKSRFIVIPSGKDPERHKGKRGETYSLEEMLLQGTDKLIELFRKAQWDSVDNPLPVQQVRFIPTTLDPSACVLEKNLLNELDLLSNPKARSGPARKIADLIRNPRDMAEAIRDEHYGVQLKDRNWHNSYYPNAVFGKDMVTWLHQQFDDIKTREEATEWGAELMKLEIIEHVRREHDFLDGVYVYHLTEQYREKQKPSGNKSRFWNPVELKKNVTEAPARASATTSTLRERLLRESQMKRRKIPMSRTIIVNLDPSGKSERSEIALLHYDAVHNPANGFHFEFHWLGITSKFLDDLRNSWSRAIEKFGLRIVEAPLEPIMFMQQKSIFRSCVRIPLLVPAPVVTEFDPDLPEDVRPETDYFATEFLRSYGWCLDIESDAHFSKEIDVIYQRKASYINSQFVHQSGLAFVQYDKTIPGFWWADNKLFTRAKEDRVGPIQAQMDDLRNQFIAVCNDKEGLTAFWESQKEKRAKYLSMLK